jgi:ATP-dependent Lon protease
VPKALPQLKAQRVPFLPRAKEQKVLLPQPLKAQTRNKGIVNLILKSLLNRRLFYWYSCQIVRIYTMTQPPVTDGTTNQTDTANAQAPVTPAPAATAAPVPAAPAPSVATTPSNIVVAPSLDDLDNKADQVDPEEEEGKGGQEEVGEIERLLKQILDSKLPQELKTRTVGMLKRLERIAKYGYFSKEFEPVEKYISWLTRIPWEVLTKDILDLNVVRAQLDKTHYGLTEVKERILEYVAMLNLIDKNSTAEGVTQSRNRAPIICFVGVAGIGKTSIAKSIATALGRKFIRIPLGGLANVKELRGVSKTEVNAEPGQIVKAFIRTESMNPLILLDEVDKVSMDENVHADIMAVLLEILDPEQNSSFTDHYIDYPVDLSRCVFICTANNLGGISAALLDRLEIIRMTSYNDDEKMHIAKDYLLPKVMQESGMLPTQIVFGDDVWPLVIRPLGFDAGIRQLERNLTALVRKVAKKIVLGEGTQFTITPENFREYMPMDIGVYS